MVATPRETTGPINIGNPTEFTIRELAESVLEITGSNRSSCSSCCPPMRKPATFYLYNADD